MLSIWTKNAISDQRNIESPRMSRRAVQLILIHRSVRVRTENTVIVTVIKVTATYEALLRFLHFWITRHDAPRLIAL